MLKKKKQEPLNRKKSIWLRLQDFKNSLVFKISGIYLLLTLVNLLVFWTANGANQMRLIRDKALLQTQIRSEEILKKLRPFLEDREVPYLLDVLLQENKTNEKLQKQKEKLFYKLKKILQDTAQSNRIMTKEYFLFSSKGRLLYSYPGSLSQHSSNSQKKAERKNNYHLPEDNFRNLLKALQLKEILNKNYYAVPNVYGDKIIIYIPLTENGVNDVVFVVRTALSSIRKELESLFTLALAMLILLLLVQTIFGYILYRILVLPIRRLAIASAKVSSGDLQVMVSGEDKADELGSLIKSFNYMVSVINKQTGQLRMKNKELILQDKLIQDELDMGKKIQKSILPQKINQDLFSIAVYYKTFQKVSGDYYDVFTLKNGSIAVLIADVSGHGIPAALLMMMSKVLFTNLLNKYLLPHEVFYRINLELISYLNSVNYLTSFLIFISPDKKAVYSNAGHRKALYWNQKTSQLSFLNSKGSILGIFKEDSNSFETQKITLNTNDKLILYTDGLIEQENNKGEMFGMKRFVSCIERSIKRSPQEIKNNVLNEITSFSEESKIKDDRTLLILEIK